MEKLTTWWPDWTQDTSCHNCGNWPQNNGNKWTLELKINFIWNNQDDAGQITARLKMTVRDCCAVSACKHPPPHTHTHTSVCKSSHPLFVSGGISLWTDIHHPPSAPAASIWNKANFPFHQPSLFAGFWPVSSQTAHTYLLVAQPSPSPIYRTLFILQTDALYPVNSSSPFSPLPSPW